MSEPPTTRRRFLQRLIYVLSSVMASAFAVPAAGYLLLPPRTRRAAEWTDAGTVSSLPLDEPQEIVLQRQRVDGWKTTTERATAWVVRTGDEVTAFVPRCTHLGCGYRWHDDTRRFVCPCHNSIFSIDGEVVSGPAPRALDRFEVRVEGERLWLGAGVPPEGGARS